jgi:hypothetical protein
MACRRKSVYSSPGNKTSKRPSTPSSTRVVIGPGKGWLGEEAFSQAITSDIKGSPAWERRGRFAGSVVAADTHGCAQTLGSRKIRISEEGRSNAQRREVKAESAAKLAEIHDDERSWPNWWDAKWWSKLAWRLRVLRQPASVQQKATEDAVKQLEEALWQRARDGFGFAWENACPSTSGIQIL